MLSSRLVCILVLMGVLVLAAVAHEEEVPGKFPLTLFYLNALPL